MGEDEKWGWLHKVDQPLVLDVLAIHEAQGETWVVVGYYIMSLWEYDKQNNVFSPN